VGEKAGLKDGFVVGTFVGTDVGFVVGTFVGTDVGLRVGTEVGLLVGLLVGRMRDEGDDGAGATSVYIAYFAIPHMFLPCSG
jgi:hypothetical protein